MLLRLCSDGFSVMYPLVNTVIVMHMNSIGVHVNNATCSRFSLTDLLVI